MNGELDFDDILYFPEEIVTEKIAFYMNYHIEGRVQTEAIVFSSNEGLLGETPGAGELLERLREQEEKENRKE